MSSHSHPALSPSAGRRALRRAMWHAVLALAVSAILAAAVDAGAGILGPALIVVGSYGGARALRDWWRHLDEEWFVAEIALVSIGWALLAGAFATLQFVAFSFAPGAFYVDLDYAKLVSPGYRAAWTRDSTRAATALDHLDRVAGVVGAGAPRQFVLDSVYPLNAAASARIVENCEDQALFERCPWQVVVTMTPGSEPIVVPIAAPQRDRDGLSLAELEHQLLEARAGLREELADYGRRMLDPSPFVQPRIADFFYDTAVAFSGNDAGIFVPISVLARVCKLIEFLASLLLFGAVVSRLSAAAAARNGLR